MDNTASSKKEGAIVFIDGNNLYHNLKQSYIKPSTIHLGKLSEWVCSHFGYSHQKTIYYNSVPSIEDGKEIYYAHMRFLDEVKSYPRFEVHTRKLQRQSTKERIQIVQQEVSTLGLCKTCEPIVKAHWADYIGSVSVKEKGIDIAIALGMVKAGIIDQEAIACILISGDADFIPALDLLKAKGIKVYSASLAKGYSFALRQNHAWFILDKKLLIKTCPKV